MGKIVVSTNDAASHLYESSTPTPSFSALSVTSKQYAWGATNGSGTWMFAASDSIAISTDDAASFSNTGPPATYRISGLAYDATLDLFLLVTQTADDGQGHPAIHYSVDGSSWTLGATAFDINPVIYDFVKVGQNHWVILATDSSIEGSGIYFWHIDDPTSGFFGNSLGSASLPSQVPHVTGGRQISRFVCSSHSGHFMLPQAADVDSGGISHWGFDVDGYPDTGTLGYSTLGGGTDNGYARKIVEGDGYWIAVGKSVSSGSFWWAYSSDGLVWSGHDEDALSTWYAVDGFFDGTYFWITATHLSTTAHALFQYDPSPATAGTWTRHDLPILTLNGNWAITGTPQQFYLDIGGTTSITTTGTAYATTGIQPISGSTSISIQTGRPHVTGVDRKNPAPVGMMKIPIQPPGT